MFRSSHQIYNKSTMEMFRKFKSWKNGIQRYGPQLWSKKSCRI